MSQYAWRVAVVALCVGVLVAAYQRTRSSTVMTQAGKQFLASLSAEQKAKAVIAFDDDERMKWYFVPRPRKGIPFKELRPAQQHLAHGLLSAGLSQRGYLKATTIMSLEEILRDLEQGKGPVRDPELYYFTIFGEPADSATWGWRVEGHHVSLNFTVVNGQLTASTPAFWGANPAEVKEGPRKGLRALEREEDLARELLHSLGAKQKEIAVIEAQAPPDIITSNARKANIGEPKGLAVARMNKKQVELLTALLEEYANNLPEDLAHARMEAVRKAGLQKIHFAWAGGLEHGQPHYYRVQGPTFLIEYDNTQNNANHIHSVWRDFNGDFGEDLLTRHYRHSPHHARKQ